VLDVQPERIHERIGFVFGSAEEVDRIERYHRQQPHDDYNSPLFGKRGLFAHAD
jgi:fructose-1,6-bisphosphatase I/sedoheptulose-1,7-bisphosphatase